jgi:hypothetical protein
VTINGVLNNLKKVGPNHWFAAANIDVEDLHRGNLVNKTECLRRGELLGVASPR